MEIYLKKQIDFFDMNTFVKIEKIGKTKSKVSIAELSFEMEEKGYSHKIWNDAPECVAAKFYATFDHSTKREFEEKEKQAKEILR